jgi:hypothetical protein
MPMPMPLTWFGINSWMAVVQAPIGDARKNDGKKTAANTQ